MDFRISAESLVLTIQDNGQGGRETALVGKGRGVANMKARTAEIGGTITITANKGTSVRVQVPLSKIPRTDYSIAINAGSRKEE